MLLFRTETRGQPVQNTVRSRSDKVTNNTVGAFAVGTDFITLTTFINFYWGDKRSTFFSCRDEDGGKEKYSDVTETIENRNL